MAVASPGYLADLNAAQRGRATEGPLLVIAGAGSGRRACSPAGSRTGLRGRHQPNEILAITFTNKAAGRCARA
jgi:superfamily I DNA/RNA helicase